MKKPHPNCFTSILYQKFKQDMIPPVFQKVKMMKIIAQAMRVTLFNSKNQQNILLEWRTIDEHLLSRTIKKIQSLRNSNPKIYKCYTPWSRNICDSYVKYTKHKQIKQCKLQYQ